MQALDQRTFTKASMGPRFFKRGEPRRQAASGRVYGASMGPRFFKRGESTTIALAAFGYTSFNGATLFQAWREC